MRFEQSVTSISWIPSEAMTGPMRVPMDIGLGHYDEAPPEQIADGDLEALNRADRFRFANRLTGWIEVRSGEIVDSGYSSQILVGSTRINLGPGSVSVPAVAYPPIQKGPEISAGSARFVQTAGGRTGAPLPRRIDRPPFVRLTAPTAWTTLALSISADGSGEFEVLGASPFPRHWIYDGDGRLTQKSGVIDFAEWTRVHDYDRSPWADHEREALLTEVESAVERDLSKIVMGDNKPKVKRLAAGDTLIAQGDVSTDVYLILDGMFDVDVDGEVVAEVGPGAVIGERAVLEAGSRTSSVIAKSAAVVAGVPASALPHEALAQVATSHRREESS
jgi:hypothetical protein